MLPSPAPGHQIFGMGALGAWEFTRHKRRKHGFWVVSKGNGHFGVPAAGAGKLWVLPPPQPTPGGGIWGFRDSSGRSMEGATTQFGREWGDFRRTRSH